MHALTDGYRLPNGVMIPCIGFGTWQTPNGDVAIASVRSAIEAGYRHIDTAQGYGNEESIGTAIRRSGVARGDIFVTSKLANPDHGYEQTLAAFNGSLKRLGMDYLDLYLIHWPNPMAFRSQWQAANAGSWKAMEELYRAGRIRAIGVSNFHPRHLDALMQTATITPMVNQIRICPGDTQDAVVDYCRSLNMVLEAYSPLGVGKIFEVPQMQALAGKYGRSIAQLCIRWSLQRGYLPLPKSITPSRIRENAAVFDFELDADDVQMMADLKGCVGYSHDPDTITW